MNEKKDRTANRRQWNVSPDKNSKKRRITKDSTVNLIFQRIIKVSIKVKHYSQKVLTSELSFSPKCEGEFAIFRRLALGANSTKDYTVRSGQRTSYARWLDESSMTWQKSIMAREANDATS